MKTLADLRKNETAVISEILGDDAISVRLMEMGLIEDEPIQLLGFAPMGDPMEFEIRGYRLSLRGTEARRVVVK